MAAKTRRPPIPARRRPAWPELAAPLLLAFAAGAETLRLGFFADDFHFLDVAARVRLLDALGGQHGIYPWYRPLSRELYFAVVTAAGPAALWVARGVSLAALAGCVVLIDRAGRGLVGSRAARMGAALFATYGFTRFLVAWASGFQDLLAVLLSLAALDAHGRGRRGRALLWAGLAPFAKETAIVALPLLAAQDLALRRGLRRRWALVATGVLAAVVALHVAVRAAWRHGGTSAHIAADPRALAGALAGVAGGFVGGAPVTSVVSFGLSLLAAVALAVWLGGAPVAGSETGLRAERRGAITFLAIASCLGLLPLIAGQAAGMIAAHAYYGFAAAPWLALLLGLAIDSLPRAVAGMVAVGLVGWNMLALGYRAPDLSSPDSWTFRRWDWPEAVRLAAVSDRLGADLRRILPSRPDSLVILYRALPEGSFFQTEDGPAARRCLADPSVRAFFVNAPPYPLAPGRYRFLNFDTDSLRLVQLRVPPRDRGAYAARALARGDAAVAWAFAAYRDSAGDPPFDVAYLSAAAALVAEGPVGWARELRATGLDDSSAAAVDSLATRQMAGAPALEPAFAAMLRHPSDAGAHIAFADRLEAMGVKRATAVELRIATTLDPGRAADRVRLANLLRALGSVDEAGRAMDGRASGDEPRRGR